MIDLMARYHINPRTGDPGVCSARISCPYGSLESDHFDSKEAARAAYEERRPDQAFTTLQRSTDEMFDDELISAIDRAVESGAMRRFDPALGPEQFEVDSPPEGWGELTDETMAEMDAHYAKLAEDEAYSQDEPFIPEDQDQEPPF